MTRGELVIIAATILVVLAVFLWIAVSKIEGVDRPRQVAEGALSASVKGADCKVGGCSVGNPTARQPSFCAGTVRRRMAQTGSRCDSGQPPISLQAFAVPLVGGLREAPAGQPSTPSEGPGGPLIENRMGRAAEKSEVSGAASARLRADAKLAQARLVCLFAAIRQVESGGDDRAVGDGGRSLGPYQCGRAAWADGGGNPADYDRLVWDRAACERVMVGFWKRHGAVTDEQRARTWNGGPRGAEKKATLKYWHKVEEVMQ